MTLQALSEYIFTSKQAAYDPQLKRRRTYHETVGLLQDTHKEFYRDVPRYDELKRHIDFAFALVRDKRVLPAQRTVQFAGRGILSKHARVYNCWASYVDRPRFFAEAFWLLLCGGGVGYSVQRCHVNSLPDLLAIDRSDCDEIWFPVPDTIEGWADALDALVSSYLVKDSQYYAARIKYDFSKIRPKGAPLSCGGKAPGPEPLRIALEAIRGIFDRATHRLRPIDCLDIMCHASNAVMSGGIRRSASIAICSPDDAEVVNAKTGTWYVSEPQRARVNISSLLLRDNTTYEDFYKLVAPDRLSGERGFFWADHVDTMTNPCAEAIFYCRNSEGKSGWQACCLSEINAAKITGYQDWYDAARAAAIVNTLQAGYTNFGYLGYVSEEIVRREALIGVSVTGMMDSPYEYLFDETTQYEIAEVIKEWNARIAELIGINASARCTVIKPAGTTSCILGTASGIHPHHSRRYFRRAQANESEPVYQHFAATNPDATQRSTWTNNPDDRLITFLIEPPEHAKVKEDLSAVEHLKLVLTTKRGWVDGGKNVEFCVKPWLSHNVSNTILVGPSEWDATAKFIYENRHDFAGVSLMPGDCDRDIDNAPMCAVYTPTEQCAMYGDGVLMASGLIVDGLRAFDDNLWTACDYALGLRKVENPYVLAAKHKTLSISESTRLLQHHEEVIAAQRDWIRRAKQFAQRYFRNDVRLMTFCLKDVHNWKLWLDLRRTYRDVNYTTLVEVEDNTQLQNEVACSGGSCEILR